MRKCKVTGCENTEFYNGVGNMCKQHHVERVRENYRKNPEKQKESTFKRKYGITLKEYNRQKRLQKCRCAICGEKKPLVVDHDHKTGVVRRLLCNNCNKMLGFAKDNADRLRSAIKYLTGD